MGVNSRTLTAKRAHIFGRGVQRMSLDRTTMTGGTTIDSAAVKRDAKPA
jgi:uncharacterized protein